MAMLHLTRQRYEHHLAALLRKTDKESLTDIIGLSYGPTKRRAALRRAAPKKSVGAAPPHAARRVKKR